jgi:radical SAM additional 4Fe4S-binding domain
MKNDLENEMFLLYGNCVIVKGYSRSLIYDLQLRKMIPIPNSLASLFSNSREIYCGKIKQELKGEDLHVFDSYMEMLSVQELGFFCTANERPRFPDLPIGWDYPAIISNCIIDSANEIIFFDKYFIEQLDRLGCYHIQLRFYNSPSVKHLSSLLEIIKYSEIQSVEVILKSTNDEDYLRKITILAENHHKIRSIIIHGHSESVILKDFFNNHGLVVTSNVTVSSELCCGIIDKNFFQTNIPLYTESLAHNTCLNRKIGIDMNGNIKNCPSMQHNYGNIKDTTLVDAVAQPGFKKFWNVIKDEIDKCKDCEFRHACTDCRAYLENHEDVYSAPLKCGYDPYSCKWEEWSTNPLKEKALTHYSMEDLVNK